MLVAILHNEVLPDDPPEDQDLLVEVETVGAALGRLGHEVATVPCTLDLESARTRLLALGPDLVFNLVEGLAGTDALQHVPPAVLEALGLPYSGNPLAAIFLTVQKLLAKERLRAAGLPTPDWATCEAARGAGRADAAAQQSPEIPKSPSPEIPRSLAPNPSHFAHSHWIIKAVWEHASRGIDGESIVEAASADDLMDRIRRREQLLGRPCFAERFIDGREFNLSILAGPEGPQVLPPAEIEFVGFGPGEPRIVGHDAKWNAESHAYHHTPRRFDFPEADRPLIEHLVELARQCWDLFGLRGYARVDFRVDDRRQPWILEINTNPCLSPDAGFAAALARAGLSFDEAVARVLADAPGTTRDAR